MSKAVGKTTGYQTSYPQTMQDYPYNNATQSMRRTGVENKRRASLQTTLDNLIDESENRFAVTHSKKMEGGEIDKLTQLHSQISGLQHRVNRML